MDTSYEAPTRALDIWNKLASYEGLLPCGLGARDTLRLEAGLCLYGQDLNDSISPIEAGLAWTVSKGKGDYVAKSIIEGQMQSGTKISRIGIEMVSQGIPRKGYAVYKGEKIGEITSGTFSPLLKKGIAMGYAPSEFAKVGEDIEVEIRGQRASAKIVKPPFYDQKLYGWKRTRKD
jgi:aminomethyltransferase